MPATFIFRLTAPGSRLPLCSLAALLLGRATTSAGMSRFASWALACSLIAAPAAAGYCATFKHAEIAPAIVSDFRSRALPSVPASWQAQAQLEAPLEPFEETEAFIAEGAAGTLILPAGAPDRRTPAIVILQDGEQPDGRASLYTDQLLGAGFAVLEMANLPDGSLASVLRALALHPRVAEQPLGLLGFGAGARLAAEWPGSVGARALLYPGCGGLIPTAMRGESVLLMHGAADPVNPPGVCAGLTQAMAASGVAVRLRVFAHAGYAWDWPAFSMEGRGLLPRPDAPGRVVSQAWPKLAAMSASEVASFFASSLLGQRP